MQPVSIHQADIWAFKIYEEAKKSLAEKNDNFDAMLFIESKSVRAVLPEIIESLNQKSDLKLDDKHNKDHYSNAILSLSKTVIEVYGAADNVISNCISEKGNELLQKDFSKMQETSNRFIAKSHQRELQSDEIVLGR